MPSGAFLRTTTPPSIDTGCSPTVSRFVPQVEELQRPAVSSGVHETLRFLIVDEYQDINPAQEELIRRLTGPDTELCVVGDDDQAIYQVARVRCEQHRRVRE